MPSRPTAQKLANGSYALVSSTGGNNLSLKQKLNKAYNIAKNAHSVGKFKGKAPNKGDILNAALKYELKMPY
jgi:hypothetical protein